MLDYIGRLTWVSLYCGPCKQFTPHDVTYKHGTSFEATTLTCGYCLAEHAPGFQQAEYVKERNRNMPAGERSSYSPYRQFP